jgi:hypothetical protein
MRYSASHQCPEALRLTGTTAGPPAVGASMFGRHSKAPQPQSRHSSSLEVRSARLMIHLRVVGVASGMLPSKRAHLLSTPHRTQLWPRNVIEHECLSAKASCTHPRAPEHNSSLLHVHSMHRQVYHVYLTDFSEVDPLTQLRTGMISTDYPVD